MRIILDVVINHSGDNWFYPGECRTTTSTTSSFDFGDSGRGRPARSRPSCATRTATTAAARSQRLRHLSREPARRHRQASRTTPTTTTPIGSDVINTLIKAHCYWIREADVDGFRVDAVKHMGELACSRFCSNIREYAYSLGKRGFFLFGEVATPADDIYNRYIGQNTSRQDGDNTVFFGIDSVLDFRLAEGVFGDGTTRRCAMCSRDSPGPQTLFNRLEAQRNRALNRGEIGRYLVTFVDNHDAFWQPGRPLRATARPTSRSSAPSATCSARSDALHLLRHRAGLRGHRRRQPDPRSHVRPGRRRARTCSTPTAASTRRSPRSPTSCARHEPLRFGRMYFRQISGDGAALRLPVRFRPTRWPSRACFTAQEVLVAYNVSTRRAGPRHRRRDAASRFLIDVVPLRRPGTLRATAPDGTRFVTVDLAPHQFVILH